MARAERPRPARRARVAAVGAFAAVVVVVFAGVADATAATRDPIAALDGRPSIDLTEGDWTWPVDPFRFERPYEAPARRYGAGHRGVDLRPLDGTVVLAPAGGTIAFAGMVADRGVVTIDHGGGLVTTLEPVESALEAGAAVARGDEVGMLSLGGHVAPGALHFGVRYEGEYINPLLLLGGVPRAVLLPCC